MTGIKYFRLKNRLTQKELAEKANCQIAVIQRLEQGYSERTRAITLHRIALALDVSLDNLARDYDDSQIDEQDRPIRPTKIKAPENCIHNYRLAHALTYQEFDLVSAPARAAEKCASGSTPGRNTFKGWLRMRESANRSFLVSTEHL